MLGEKGLLRLLPKLPFFQEKEETELDILQRLVRGEDQAIEEYAEAAARMRGFRDMKTAGLLEHIRSEEMHHLEELNSRIRRIMFGGS